MKKLELFKTHDSCVGGIEPRLTVVIIHGIASDSSAYSRALEYLEGREVLSGVRFVTFDLLGAGKSLISDELEYNYDEELEALHNSIEKLNVNTPLVLVGHSLGTFIVTRYACAYKDDVSRLILISPPVYTPADLEHPDFKKGMEAFDASVKAKNPDYLNSKAYQNLMKNIVMDKDNYDVLSHLGVPTVLIYGVHDQLIASYNIPGILKINPDYLSAIKTDGRHSVTSDKYEEIGKLLERILHA